MEPIHTFSLGFNAPFNQSAKIRLPHANPSIQNETVVQAMDDIIASGAIVTVSGPITSRKSAQITTRTTSDFELTNTVSPQ